MSTHEETGERRGCVLPKVTKKSGKSWLVLNLPPFLLPFSSSLPPSLLPFLSSFLPFLPSIPEQCPLLNSPGKTEAEAVVKVFIRGAVPKP